MMTPGKPGHPRFATDGTVAIWTDDGSLTGDGMVIWVDWNGGGSPDQAVFWDAASETYSVDLERGRPVPFSFVRKHEDRDLAQVRT